MSGVIRILHLEDDPADAALVDARLHAEGISCVLQRVDNRMDFESALNAGGWDVIFADYQLPSYDGVKALDHVLRVAPETPLIMVSGTLGEDAAIDCLTKGATDYVTKQKLSRLGPVVRRALLEAEDRRVRKRSEEEIALLNFALNNVHESAYLIDADGHFAYVNKEACRSLGYTAEEMLRMDVHDIHPEFPEPRWRTHWEELKAKRSLTFAGRHLTRTGDILEVEIHA
ncbi:partial Transcriptional regulatory protein TcrA, partial [Anaerolineae bacterium]